jgi:hypothetical protein
MIGFHSPDSILTKQVYFSPTAISIRITLKAKQKIYSSGINEEKMNDYKISTENFNEIEFSFNKPTDRISTKKSIKGLIDDV